MAELEPGTRVRITNPDNLYYRRRAVVGAVDVDGTYLLWVDLVSLPKSGFRFDELELDQ